VPDHFEEKSMSLEPDTQGHEDFITLQGEDGQDYPCQILQIFDFDNKEYALLLNLAEESTNGTGEDSGSLVVMRLTQQGEQAIFQTIESEEEFQKVVAYVEEMSKGACDDEECAEH
jgi:uncharacterized protein YrzB (UPF0473 family)